MVQGMTLLFTLEQDCEQFAGEVAQQLNGSGLQVVRSFDLQSARAAHPGYGCPHHGTATCTCQVIVLLVYGRQGLSTTLMIHGIDGRSQIFLVDRPEQRLDAGQKLTVLRTLKPGIFDFASPGEAAGIA